jgi:hypothetical protein
LLLIAVGLEARFFERAKDPVERAMTTAVVLILCVAEMLAITSLVISSEEGQRGLHPTYDFIAFVVTIDACVIALVSLAHALLSRIRDDDREIDNRQSSRGDLRMEASPPADDPRPTAEDGHDVSLHPLATSPVSEARPAGTLRNTVIIASSSVVAATVIYYFRRLWYPPIR